LKIFFIPLLILSFTTSNAQTLKVGSKKFTESVILSEILKLGLKNQGNSVVHLKELGGTTLLWNALTSGDIDLYPEYTGTIDEEILRTKTKNILQLRELLASKGIGITESLGFNNTYAVGMKKKQSEDLGIKTISDLAQHPDLKIGWGDEFRQRQDGWPGLQRTYGLTHKNVRGMDHDIAYRALVQGDIDVIDLYQTDAEIPYYDIYTLEDNLKHFPNYESVILYRLDKTETVLPFLKSLEGKVSNEKMTNMNKLAKIDKQNPEVIASDFLKSALGKKVLFEASTRSERVLKATFEHLKLVGVSLFFAILFAIPLGVAASKFSYLGKVILMIVSAIQTIPALALLVLMIKPLSLMGLSGIGDTPAFIALFLYSLLPIVRNTYSGLIQIPMGLQETATVLGTSKRTRLLKIELPLAMPSILTGIKTSLVLNIGFATLGALVGAGGYGASILTGIRLDDYSLILEGALPATILALLAQQIFDFLEKYLVSPGLRI
jgi:osmoprotectant transport system permease protein